MRSRRSDARPAEEPPAKADEKRREIILAAAAEFSRKGYAETTLGDIANRLGIHTAGLYYYFKNKDAVVEAVLKYAAQRILMTMKQALKDMPDASPIEQLKAVIRNYILLGGQRDDVGRAFHKIYDQVSPELRKTVLGEARAVFSMWRKLVNKAVETGELKSDIPSNLLRQLLIGSMMWIPQWYKPGGETSLDEIADAAIAFFVREAGRRSGSTRATDR